MFAEYVFFFLQEGEENKENQEIEENSTTEHNSIYQLFDIFDEKVKISFKALPTQRTYFITCLYVIVRKLGSIWGNNVIE